MKHFEVIKNGLLFKENILSEIQKNVLYSLIEQGNAENRTSEIFISWTNLLSLENDLKRILSLPLSYEGEIYLEPIKQQTTSPDFEVKYGYFYKKQKSVAVRNGAFLKISGSTFLLSIPQYNVLEAIDSHSIKANKTEEDNLYLIYALKNAISQGLKLNLQQFNDFHFIVADTVRLQVEKQDNGDLNITPYWGNTTDPATIKRHLHQIEKKVRNDALRIRKEILILNPKIRAALKEAIKISKIDSSQSEDFLTNPSSFIDGSLIDIEHGFSSRVQGVTSFKLAYFGKQEASGISWFEGNSLNDKKLEMRPIEELGLYMETEEDIKDFESLLSDANKANATILDFGNVRFDISDKNLVKEIVEEIKENGIPFKKGKSTSDKQRLVLNIKKNDEILEYSENLDEYDQRLYQGKIDETEYNLSFLEHQKIGIRWLLGFAEKSFTSKKTTGCLLADDMGLGKTFTSLVALREFLLLMEQKIKRRKPILVVAPVSLLENWKDEVNKAYKKSFFKNIIMLTAGADLKKYTKEILQKELYYSKNITDSEISLNEVPYSLKIGKEFGEKRLDLDGNLVLTNYDTLRNYSASFARVDWGAIVFDEIQMIKNPNTLSSIAAKALKASFKLAVTGTPVENSLKDIWNIFDVVNSGFLGEYQKFRTKYIKPLLSGDEIVKNQIGTKLRQHIGYSMLRREKSDCIHDLPPKNIYKGVKTEDEESLYDKTLDIPMTEEQENQYQRILEEYYISDKKKKALETLQKLKAVSLCPILMNKELDITTITAEDLFKQSSKLAILPSLLDNIKKRKEKVIIFLINKRLQFILQALLEKKYKTKIQVINGDSQTTDSTTTKGRKKLIEEFEKIRGFGIIIMSPIAAGVGLTVTGANNVIHLERHWNPAKENQATDRVYRIGQEKNVNIYIPISKYSKGTSFDEHLDNLLSKKINLNKSIVTPTQFTEEEIIKFFLKKEEKN